MEVGGLHSFGYEVMVAWASVGSKGGEKWVGCKYIFKVESSGFAEGLKAGSKAAEV